MTSYGFRMYRFEIRKERTRKEIHPLKVESKDKPTWYYRTHLLSAAEEYRDRSVHGLPPKLDAADRDQNLDLAPVFRLVDIEQEGDHLFGSVRHGRPAGHDLALPKASLSGKPPIDISDYSPTREYRFAFYFPEPGNEGILAVEAISGACPTRYLVQWARWWSQAAGMKAKPEEPWYNLRASALADAVQISDFIDNSQVVEVVLVAGKKGASRQRKTEEFRITSTLNVQGKAKALQELNAVIQAGQSDEELAEALAAHLGRNVEDIDLDDGWVVVDTDYGQQQISPSRIPDVFTYPIGETEPDDPTFYDALKVKARALAKHVNGTFDLGQ